MRISNAIGRAIIAAALAGMAGGGMTALAQTGQETETTLVRDLTVAQKPLYQLTSGADTLDVEAWVDNPSLTYAIGQPMRVMVRPRQDAHITVVNVDADGRVAVLYPNHFQRETHVRAGSIVMIPHEGASWRFKVTGPVGVDLFKIFASRQPLSLPELDQLVRASEKSPLVTLGRSADSVARDLVAQLKPDAAGADQQTIGMRNILVRVVAEAPPAVGAIAPAVTVRTDRQVYRVGEKVKLSVTAHRDCRLTLVSVGASGNAVQLFPNPFQPDDPLIRPGQWIEIPLPLSPLEIVARAPAGSEGIVAVCHDAPARPQHALQGGFALLGTLQSFGRDLIASSAGQDPAKPETSSTSYLVVE
jgi:hypothetical protein